MSTHDECLEWDRARNNKGYGTSWSKSEKRARYVHRQVWEEERGNIQAGMCVLHRCDNPPCINIDHLFLGTHKDNSRDMIAKDRGNGQYPKKLTCKRGHSLAEAYVWRGDGRGRSCRLCQQIRNKERRAKDPSFAEKQNSEHREWVARNKHRRRFVNGHYVWLNEATTGEQPANTTRKLEAQK